MMDTIERSAVLQDEILEQLNWMNRLSFGIRHMLQTFFQ